MGYFKNGSYVKEPDEILIDTLNKFGGISTPELSRNVEEFCRTLNEMREYCGDFKDGKWIPLEKV